MNVFVFRVRQAMPKPSADCGTGERGHVALKFYRHGSLLDTV